jgi:hypothetical protein
MSNIIRHSGACRTLFPVLVGSLLLMGTLTTHSAQVKSQATVQTRFRFEAVSDKSLGLWEGERPVFVYNHGEMSKPSAPTAQSRSTYLHPIYGLDGEGLTDEFPKDHVYDRGLYWAWPHIKVADQEYDVWSLRGLRTEFKRWLAQETKPNLAVLSAENGWFVGDKEVMREKVWIQAHPASSESRSIDVELTWTPTDQPVTPLTTARVPLGKSLAASPGLIGWGSSPGRPLSRTHPSNAVP